MPLAPFAALLYYLSRPAETVRSPYSPSALAVWEPPQLDEVGSTGREVFEGSISLNGQLYSISCSCGKPGEDLPLTANEYISSLKLAELKANGVRACNPTRIDISEERPPSPGLSPLSIIQEGYGQIFAYQLGDLKRTTLYCSDDRTTEPAISVLGGELGQFLLGLAAVDRTVGSNGQVLEDPTVIEDLISGWANFLAASGRNLLLCNDDDGLTTLARAVGATSLALDRPTESMKAEVLRLIGSTIPIGDRFLKSVMTSPESYGLRRAVVTAVVSATLSLVWNGGPAVLITLPGPSGPEAVLRIRETQTCTESGTGALIRARTQFNSGEIHRCFVMNQGSSNFRWLELIDYLVAAPKLGPALASLGGKNGTTAETLLARMDSISSDWTEHFLSTEPVLSTLPVYTLTLTEG